LRLYQNLSLKQQSLILFRGEYYTKSIGMKAPVYTNYVERGIAYLMLGNKEASQKDFR